MSKFKTGDIVRCVDNTDYENQLVQTKTYEVLGVSAKYTSVRNESGREGGYLSSRFELAKTPKTSALEVQVGGTHYTDMAIQPAHYNLANNIGWAEGDAISYISRWRNKGGLQDLRKARQTLLLLIEHEEAKGTE